MRKHMTLVVSDNVERKPAKEGKTWRTKIAHKFRQPGMSTLDTVDSVQPPRVFGVSLEKSVPSSNNEVVLRANIKYLFFADVNLE